MPSDWIEALGIHVADSGISASRAAREKILEPAMRILESSERVTSKLLVFQGFVARAQALHDGAIQMIEAQNPHPASTLLRAYAENAAAILYAKDHPTRVEDLADYANKRFGGFIGIYEN